MEENELEAPKELEETKIDDGGVKIADEVVAVIAGVAVSEVQGVYSMAGGFAGGITEVLSGKKNLAKGIKVEINENTAKIDVNILVEYGSRIPEVAYEIQNKVKKAVETMSGLSVLEVNVHIQGVNTSDNNFVNEEKQENNTEEQEKPIEQMSEANDENQYNNQ